MPAYYINLNLFDFFQALVNISYKHISSTYPQKYLGKYFQINFQTDFAKNHQHISSSSVKKKVIKQINFQTDFANPKWRLAGGIWGGGDFLLKNKKMLISDTTILRIIMIDYDCDANENEHRNKLKAGQKF